MKSLRKMFLFLIAMALCAAHAPLSLAADSGELPVKGIVTMIDLGAKSCIPCKMMAPILEEVEKEYRGRAAIVFIDVWQNQELAKRFKVSAIPTQIFFDKTGKEVYRHLGFMDKNAIVAELAKLGIKAK